MKTLVLSGGADYGSFQLGVLKFLILEKGHRYNSMYGVSVGALNASFLAMFEDQAEGILQLEQFWLNVKKSDIYKRWFPFGKIHGLWKPSLYNATPLKNMVRKNLDVDKIKNITVGVGVVSMKNGKFKMFYNDHPKFKDAVVASSSFPLYFQPISIDGELYTDGGLKHVAPMGAAIDNLKVDESIDAVITYDRYRDYNANKKNNNVINVALNSVDFMRQAVEDSDVDLTLLYNKLVSNNLCEDKKFAEINLFYPEDKIKGNSIDFDHTDIVKTIELGYETAKKQYKE